MQDIEIKLKADNTSGKQTLSLSRDGDEYWFTLTGDYEGEPVQVDFNIMQRSDFEELHTAIGLILDSLPSNTE